MSKSKIKVSFSIEADDLVDEIMKDSRSMAIKKLKRMLNERL